ncbi:hypothetical protein HYT52_01615 [Candidatus Woesearchaeota archaeon]|nr:hypothetical protein [Candidatus Woesearchaeota archaeon]
MTEQCLQVDINPMLQAYRRHIRHFSPGSIQCVGWKSEQSARENYGAATSVQNWKDIHRILDIGSGYSDLLSFLRQERNYAGSYTGIEIVDDIANVANSRVSHDPLARVIRDEFLARDFTAHGFSTFDWLLSLGIFTYKQPDQEKFDIAVLRKMKELKEIGITIYLNDESRVPPEKIESCPYFRAVDISSMVNRIASIVHPDHLDIIRYPHDESQKIMIHAYDGGKL